MNRGRVRTAAIAAPLSRRLRRWGRWSLRGFVCAYLLLMIALPLASLFERGLSGGLGELWNELRTPIALDALKLTIGAAAVMTVINAVMGTLTAYVLVRYEFPGRRLLDVLVEMPFAVPTLVMGLMLVVLYGPQSIVGGWLGDHGVRLMFARPGIVLALLMVCFPFVVRSVQPVLEDVEKNQEEAAATLGATRWTTFRRVILPAILPAIVMGSLLGFARALGEFGSIVVVAGNMPRRTLTAPVYIFGEIESHNERGASVASLVLLAMSFTLMVLLDQLNKRQRLRHV